jgi:hypothetical protein
VPVVVPGMIVLVAAALGVGLGLMAGSPARRWLVRLAAVGATVFLLVSSVTAYAFGGAVWLQQGQVSALLPERPDPAYVRSFVHGFPGQPVFLVGGERAPRGYASLRLRLAQRFTYRMPVWEETYLTRPSRAVVVPIPVSIWRVEGT